MSSPPAVKGLFIVLEGGDGTGKSTQHDELLKHLESAGYDVEAISFPRYGQPSAYFVEQYLGGKYGNASSVGPHIPSYFYALDRYAAKEEIEQALAAGKIVLADRYTGSNMAHQGAKFERREERMAFFNWLDDLEYKNLKIPRPDINVILSLPVEVSEKLVDERAKAGIKQKDIHEKDPMHNKMAAATYEDIVAMYPKNFIKIDCARNSELLPIDKIHNIIWERIEPMLPKKPKKVDPPSVPKQAGHQGGDLTSKTTSKHTEYVTRHENGSYTLSQAGKDYLEDAVTNTDKDVYVFKEKLPQSTVAAAMARLSRRSDDMRVTILEEFADKEGKDEALLRRVITAYGDDSVQQLAGTHVVVENASNLLTKKLEWGRLAAYLEQSTRYIFFDDKDQKGNYKYYTPSNLDAKTAQLFEKTVDQIFDIYSEMVRALTDFVRENSKVTKDEQDFAWKGATKAQACDAIRDVLPVATKSTVGIFASGQALESLIMHLLSDELVESRNTGQTMLEEARKVVPVFLERADKPDRGGATIAYRANNFQVMKKTTDDYLPQNLSPETKPVSLNYAWPRNEFDLIPHMLYEHSNLPLEQIQEEVETWSYDKKIKVFESYIGERLNRRHKPGRALEHAYYSWDLVCDYGIFRDLQRHRMVDDLAWQPLTPLYGYDVPELVEEAGLSDKFEQCFDLSFKLYSDMQAAGYELEAQYATLLGHRMRWKITYNAREAFHFHELRTTPQGHPGYRKLVKQMHDKVAEVHPMLAAAMKFVNKDEDPELSRLAAERYTQYKLEKLDKDSLN